MPVQADIHAALSSFSNTLTAKFALPGHANPEDQLKKPVEDFFVAIGTTMGKHVDVRTEAQLRQEGARPDMAIYVDGLICGLRRIEATRFRRGPDPVSRDPQQETMGEAQEPPKPDLYGRSRLDTVAQRRA